MQHTPKEVKNCYLSVEAVLLLEGLCIDHPEDYALLLACCDADPHLLKGDLIVLVGIENLKVGVGLSLNELSAKVRESLITRNLPTPYFKFHTYYERKSSSSSASERKPSLLRSPAVKKSSASIFVGQDGGN